MKPLNCCTEMRQMNRIVIDAEGVETREMLHSLLAERLNFPEWYGKNLDALYDCLTDINEETEIEFTNTEFMKNSLGGYYNRFLTAVRVAADENKNLKINI